MVLGDSQVDLDGLEGRGAPLPLSAALTQRACQHNIPGQNSKRSSETL